MSAADIKAEYEAEKAAFKRCLDNAREAKVKDDCVRAHRWFAWALDHLKSVRYYRTWGVK